MIQSRRPLSPQAALVKLQDLCARSEQCSHEVLTKLNKWAIGETTARKILALLKRDRYVDDRRYAEAFVRDKVVFNRWGRVKIRLALIAKKVDRDIIDVALATVDTDEYTAALRQVLRAKALSMTETDSYESRTKLLRYAVSRGFEVSEVVRWIKNPKSWRQED